MNTDKDKMVSCLIYKALMTFIDKESKKEKTRFLGGYPYETDPHNKNLEFSAPVNLGAEFVLRTMNGNGPVKQAVKAVKSYLRSIHFTNMHELEENTQSFLFKTAFVAPAKYIPLLMEAGLDINAKRCHPIYTSIKKGEEYPLFVFAAEVGDKEKLKVLIENGTDKVFAADAIDACRKSDVLSASEKASVLNLFKAYNIEVPRENKKTNYTLKESDEMADKAADQSIKTAVRGGGLGNLFARLVFRQEEKELD